MRKVVYVAGPYAPAGGVVGVDAETEIRRNVARALALGRLAAVQGLAPIVPHAMGFLGVYGTPDESGVGVRERAVEAGEAHAALVVGRDGGLLWMLLRDDGSLSSGCQLERAAFRGCGGSNEQVNTWAGWRDAFVAAELEAVWVDPVAAFGLEL